jgi:PAS domain S-box-containing protein
MANNVSNAMRVAVSNMQYGMPAMSASSSAGLQLMDKGRVEDQMAAERRLRNREHAKRSRVRKKFMLESLQQQVRGLQDENSTLRMLVQKHIPQQALKIIDDCCSKSVLFATGEDIKADGTDKEADAPQDGKPKETPLLRSDFSLIESLTSGQQNFVLSDPRLPDNPIVFASPGFYELTGYSREQVLGRNCRFLQGAGTDRKAVDVIRTAVANGTDATVCLLNYKADGTPFWNQLFVAALRDGDNCIVNYVGVQTMIEPNAGASALEDKVNAAHPMTVGVEEENDNKDASANE